MHYVEPVEHAPEWLHRAAWLVKTKGPPRAVAFFRLNGTRVRHGYEPLRDRTVDATAMLRGLAGDLAAEIHRRDFTGVELADFTADACASRVAPVEALFRILVV